MSEILINIANYNIIVYQNANNAEKEKFIKMITKMNNIFHADTSVLYFIVIQLKLNYNLNIYHKILQNTNKVLYYISDKISFYYKNQNRCSFYLNQHMLILRGLYELFRNEMLYIMPIVNPVFEYQDRRLVIKD